MAKPRDAAGGNSGPIAGEKLRAFIERVERLEEEKKALAEDIGEVYGEAKAEGYDVKILRKIVRMRKVDKAKRDEEETVTDLYLSALGML